MKALTMICNTLYGIAKLFLKFIIIVAILFAIYTGSLLFFLFG